MTIRKPLYHSCWTELTCQGILLPLDLKDSRHVIFVSLCLSGCLLVSFRSRYPCLYFYLCLRITTSIALSPTFSLSFVIVGERASNNEILFFLFFVCIQDFIISDFAIRNYSSLCLFIIPDWKSCTGHLLYSLFVS